MKQRAKNHRQPPSARRNRGAKVELTREDVRRAMERFRQEGGLIHTLPPQASGRRRSAGASIDTGVESVTEG